MKKFLAILSLSLFLCACTPQQRNIIIPVPQNEPKEIPVTATPKPQTTPTPSASATPKESPLPTPQQIEVLAAFLAPVPFTPQAPDAVWDDLHNEACEEASMIMADVFFHKKSLDQTIAESEIQKQVAWQTAHGFGYDITASQAADILKTYFSLEAKVSEDITPANIIYALSQGKLIIAPFAGRLLGNPYYRQPGPLYHMMVIRGYDANKKEFITNDPGTRHGEAYRYSYATLLNAIHDWPKPGKTKDDVTEAEMEAGKKS